MQKQKQKSKSITIFHNKETLLHKSSKAHPEHPQRITYILNNLEYLMKTNPNIKIVEIQYIDHSNDAEKREQLIQELIRQTHGQSYWQFVKQMWYEGIKKPEMYINMDTYFMKNTYHAAKEAVRTTIAAVDALHKDSNQSCFSLVRPPGHHCGMKSQPHGFSFFNNLGIAVNYAINAKKFDKIAIVDWDAHHGEGTQNLFYSRKNPLFISLHRFDNGKFFPHIKQSGSQNVGEKQGEGYNINICWNLKGAEDRKKNEPFERNQTCGDKQYAYAFQKIVIPILKQYNPDAIFISCGFDSAKGDLIGGLQITQAGYAFMTKQIMKLKKKTLFVFEGGYTEQPLVVSSEAVINTVTENLSESTKDEKQLSSGVYEPNKIGLEGVNKAKQMIETYWNLD